MESAFPGRVANELDNMPASEKGLFTALGAIVDLTAEEAYAVHTWETIQDYITEQLSKNPKSFRSFDS
jgi:hypothetical protein